ncbi:MAG TPA: exodeoxyribonuclease V subunit gamma [Deltaproteobacteria bacterium]|nr:exodeoxyribonuclease V subunit gamma [Deltaproteobacteria bacterium]
MGLGVDKTAGTLTFYRGNRLETLAERLCDLLSQPCGGPFEPETVVVSSRGMQRWLSLEIAARLKVCANVNFPFQKAFVLDMFSRVLGGKKPGALFAREVMTQRIMEVLPCLATGDAWRALEGYLALDPEGLKLYQLSSSLANLFDQYLVYRPDMVAGWEEGKTSGEGDVERWQKELWARAFGAAGFDHPARMADEFCRAVGQAPAEVLPKRVFVFSVHSWPPSFLRVLAALSSRTEVHLFCLDPCREYWADIKSERRIARVASHGRVTDLERLHLEVGNEVLAAFGDANREFLDMVYELECDQEDLFDDVDETCVLGRIQGDILGLARAGERGVQEVDPRDRSLQVHACYSAMREVEVLKDVLLDLFETCAGLEPKDVLVTAPDIEPYVPLVRAVFDADRDGPRSIPYSISDRSFRRSSTAAEALVSVMALARGRFTATEVLDLLDHEPVRSRFGFGAQDLQAVHEWVRSASIRWGMDGAHKASLGLPPFEENTWAFGLRRMLLGYAMRPGKDLFSSMAPLEGVDLSQAELLGRFCDFVERLEGWVRALKGKRTFEEWSGLLLGLLDDLVQVGPDSIDDILRLRKVIEGIGEASALAGNTREVGVAAAMQALLDHLDEPAEGSGFLERGVTFCSMLPMRAVPFRVVCILGMNHDDYPRKDAASMLDLMKKRRRRGDRSLRLEDLSLFLETLLSAREVLCLSYVGMGIQDNALKPPSVVVSAILDYLDKGFVSRGGGKASEAVLRRHHLQAFNPAYFTKADPIHSFSERDALAARALVSAGPPGGPVVDAAAGAHVEAPATSAPGADGAEAVSCPGASPAPAIERVPLKGLIDFYSNPARCFLERTLGARPPRDDGPLEDSEPVTLEGLERYVVDERVLAGILEGEPKQRLFSRLRAEGLLPHGEAGRVVFEEAASRAASFVERLSQLCKGVSRRVERVRAEIGRYVLEGDVELFGHGVVASLRPAEPKTKDHLGMWVRLLAYRASGGHAEKAYHLGLDKVVSARPPADPRAALETLIEVYLEGLRRPVHLFPNSSYAYAEELVKGGDEEKAMAKARTKWAGDYEPSPDSDDEAVQLLFHGTDPLDEEFRIFSARVFLPMVEAQKKG